MKKSMIIASCLLLLAGCRESRQAETAERSIKADTVRVYGHAGSINFPGKVMASSDINLAFRVNGPIGMMNARVGARVKKGELLAQIDPRDYELQLAATEAEYNRIKAEVGRITELHEKGSVTPNDYDKARYGYQQIAAKLDAHRNALNDTRLLAPADGYIQKRLFEPGETVSAGMPVISMIAAASGVVEINIPSADYIRRDQFADYSCRADLFPGVNFPLELIGITPKANANQLYTMRFRMKGGAGEIPGPGMSVMVTVQFRNEETETLSIPLSSVFQSDNSATVWIYDPASETVSARSITVTEILTDGKAVVSSGLEEGEWVVTAGIHSLKEGQKVKLLPPATATNVGGLL
ncbi:MAG: efflux RND transporter periplasmic adaptor subunit [bacterium]|nr:efflux RND transporter periplasmic adaptor subunit [bacterium]